MLHACASGRSWNALNLFPCIKSQIIRSFFVNYGWRKGFRHFQFKFFFTFTLFDSFSFLLCVHIYVCVDFTGNPITHLIISSSLSFITQLLTSNLNKLFVLSLFFAILVFFLFVLYNTRGIFRNGAVVIDVVPQCCYSPLRSWGALI